MGRGSQYVFCSLVTLFLRLIRILKFPTTKEFINGEANIHLRVEEILHYQVVQMVMLGMMSFIEYN